ncbi:MAG TPA: hypothetical protein VLW46_00320 [Candidatus Bathyarchaeia archaeon]|nr:hypothetical protein [Candidatus Bathyarchaeia archaeon]
MLRRTVLLLSFLLVVVSCIVPAPALAQVKGAVVQTWHYDPRANAVTATIVNLSRKDITGYNISITETYANAPVNKHEMLCDYIARIALLQRVQGTPDEADVRKQFGDGLFHPGESRNEVFGVRAGLTDFQAVVDVVAYADETADASNNDGLQRLLTHRKAAVASRQIANEILKNALADPNDTDPAATAAAKLQQRLTLWKAEPHTTLDFEPGEVKGIVDELKGMSARHEKRDALDQYLSRREAEVSTLSPHANLHPGGLQ